MAKPATKSSFFYLLLLFTTCACLKLNHDTDDNYNICGTKNKCVKKCCPEKHVLIKRQCVLSEDIIFAFDIFDETTNITHKNITLNIIHDNNKNCKGKRKLKLSPKFENSDKFFVQSDGSIFKPFDYVLRKINFEDYCLETFVRSNQQELSAIVCYSDENLEKVDKLSYIGEYC